MEMGFQVPAPPSLLWAHWPARVQQPREDSTPFSLSAVSALNPHQASMSCLLLLLQLQETFCRQMLLFPRLWKLPKCPLLTPEQDTALFPLINWGRGGRRGGSPRVFYHVPLIRWVGAHRSPTPGPCISFLS